MRSILRMIKQFFGTSTKSPEKVFEKIYQTNFWGGKESVSGAGSDDLQTKKLITELSKQLRELKVSQLLDIPCGDFFWMKKVNLKGIKYTGGDIVPDLIEENKQKFKNEDNLDFIVHNLIQDSLPPSDLLIVRDCLVHLSYADIWSCLENILIADCTYLLTTTFCDRLTNEDIETGEWRPLNLEKSPFKFPSPLLIIDENCTQGAGKFSDKSMGLWKIADLRKSIRGIDNKSNKI